MSSRTAIFAAVLPIAGLLATAVILPNEASARGNAVVREHGATSQPQVRDHRSTAPTVRDHRSGGKVVQTGPSSFKLVRNSWSTWKPSR